MPALYQKVVVRVRLCRLILVQAVELRSENLESPANSREPVWS
jgi:hypothetical protein